mgnify:CR=1 FL=1|jgi:Universal stress protein UspA and related nucleotide-binding proteins
MTSQRYHRVIVGYDGSPAAETALAWAAREARLHRAPLVTLTAVRERPEEPAATDLLVSLRRSVAAVTGDHVPDVRCVPGSPAAELVAACTPADLLVVGREGGGALAGVLLGSVSRACLHQAPCSVAVVPAGERRSRHDRVIAAVDGSAASRHALCRAADEARLRGAELRVVHAVYWDHLGVELITPTPEELVSWGERLVAAELAETGVHAATEIVHGHPKRILVQAAGNADLLVLGHRGRNPLAGLLLGSTSEHCARHAPCPVIVVRPAQGEG